MDAGTQHVPVLPYHRVQIAGVPASPDQPAEDLAGVLSRVDDATGRVGIIERSPTDDVAFGILDLPGDPPVVRTLHERILDQAAPGNALRFTHSATDAEDAVRSGNAIAANIDWSANLGTIDPNGNYIAPATGGTDTITATATTTKTPGYSNSSSSTSAFTGTISATDIRTVATASADVGPIAAANVRMVAATAARWKTVHIVTR